jgi:hypothetical protein
MMPVLQKSPATPPNPTVPRQKSQVYTPSFPVELIPGACALLSPAACHQAIGVAVGRAGDDGLYNTVCKILIFGGAAKLIWTSKPTIYAFLCLIKL